jgi:hypothetical protein
MGAAGTDITACIGADTTAAEPIMAADTGAGVFGLGTEFQGSHTKTAAECDTAAVSFAPRQGPRSLALLRQ